MICAKRNADFKIKIKRLSYNDTLINLYAYNACLEKMRKEI